MKRKLSQRVYPMTQKNQCEALNMCVLHAAPPLIGATWRNAARHASELLTNPPARSAEPSVVPAACMLQRERAALPHV